MNSKNDNAAKALASKILDAIDLNRETGITEAGQLSEGTRNFMMNALRARDGNRLRSARAFGRFLSDNSAGIAMYDPQGSFNDLPVPEEITARWIITWMGYSAIWSAVFNDDGETICDLLAAGLPDYGQIYTAIYGGMAAAVSAFLDAGVQVDRRVLAVSPGADGNYAAGRAAALVHPKLLLSDQVLASEFDIAGADGDFHSAREIFLSEIMKRMATGNIEPFADLNEPSIRFAQAEAESVIERFRNAGRAPEG